MTFWEVVIAIVLGMFANELFEWSVWCANRIIRVAVRLRYTDSERRNTRLIELTALIAERPGKLLKLCTSLGFLAVALPGGLRRALRRRLRRATKEEEKPDKLPFALGGPIEIPSNALFAPDTVVTDRPGAVVLSRNGSAVILNMDRAGFEALSESEKAEIIRFLKDPE